MRCVTAIALLLSVAALQGQAPYQRPSATILKVLDAPLPPGLNLAPDGRHALLTELRRYPAVKDLARPMLRLAGTRIDPRTHGPHNPPRLKSMSMLDLASGTRKDISLPAGPAFGPPRWSPDGKRFVLTGTTGEAVELWVGGTAGPLKKVPGVRLNAAFGNPLDWMGSTALIAKAVPATLGPAPAAPDAPAGPRIQEHDPAKGKASGMATFQDLLQNAADEALFVHYATSQLVRIDLASLQVRPIGAPGLIGNASPAPDGRHLLVTTLHPPFSYLVTADRFPQRHQVWDLQGKSLATVADLPLAEDIPLEGVRKGPRGIGWVPTAPATLHWTEALDGGNPKAKVPHRDRLMTLAAPFTEASELARTEHRMGGGGRMGGAAWTEDGKHILYSENDRERRWTRTWLRAAGGGEPRKLWDLSALDRYRNPGQPVLRVLPSGHAALRIDEGALWLSGQGATPAGNRPFLDRLALADFKTTRVFQSPEKVLQQFAGLQPDGSYLTRRESASEPPNYLLHPAGKGEAIQVTQFKDPAPELRGIQKRLVKYKRPDGVDLSFTLYLPPDYQPGERRPALLWAYPMEFTDPATAGQVSGSTDSFSTLAGTSHLFMLLKGYVVLDDATMPVVGNPETVNNTFLEQVVASAKAAIDKADELGVIDPKRVAVGGHSYGAFMTANLLAHADLFKCGIARSGAYNRTLTPFGFQSERRTLWEAPEMYLKVSPFMKANAFKAPILLIHGEADNNSGTFPIQSERLFQALKGNNLPVRYVTLPHESHGYAGRESVEHTLWEMGGWLDRHLK